MNPPSIRIYESAPSSVCTEDGDESINSPLVAFRNCLVVKTPQSQSRRRSSASITDGTASMSWHDSMEDFTDGEDFLIGSPLHTNLFREEGSSAGSVRRTRDISLDDPMASHISLPLALEPRPDSPECVESEFNDSSCLDDSTRSERGAGGADSSRRSNEKDPSKKKRRHKKRRDDHRKESSSHLKDNKETEEKAKRSKKKDTSRHRSSRREDKPHTNQEPRVSERAKSTTKSRSTRGRDLDVNIEKTVEKAVCERVLALSLDDLKPQKKKVSSKSRHEKKSRRGRQQSIADNGDDNSAATEAARQRIQEAHVLAMQMLQKARESEPILHYDVDRPASTYTDDVRKHA